MTSFNVEKYMSELHFAPTTNLFIRRVVVEKLGGFDRRLWSSGDWEFGDRIWNSGFFSQRYDKDVRVFHYARNFRSKIKKKVRVLTGQTNLFKLYPKRFRYTNENRFIKLVKIIYVPPSLLKRKETIRLSIFEKSKILLIAYLFEMIKVYVYIYVRIRNTCIKKS